MCEDWVAKDSNCPHHNENNEVSIRLMLCSAHNDYWAIYAIGWFDELFAKQFEKLSEIWSFRKFGFQIAFIWWIGYPLTEHLEEKGSWNSKHFSYEKEAF